MVEGTDTGWLTVLEKKELHQTAGILEIMGNNISVSDIDEFLGNNIHAVTV